MGDILGYARVSTFSQDMDSQKIRLEKEGAIRIFEDVISGKSFEACFTQQSHSCHRPFSK